MKKLISAAVATSLLLLVGAGAANADGTQTRTLASGNTLYAIDCDSYTGQLATVDPLTAVATAVGTGSDVVTPDSINCAGQAAWEIGTNNVYWFTFDQPARQFFKMDLTTGDSTYIGDFSGTGVGPSDGDVESLAMGPDKTLYAIYWDWTNDVDRIGTVNISTGAITDIGEIQTSGSAARFYAFAYNPADGEFYAADESAQHLWQIDVTNGVATDQGMQFANFTMYSMAFDQDGTIFTTSNSTVTTFTFDTWASEAEQSTASYTTLDSAVWYSESNFITYDVASNGSSSNEPTLAETGSSSLPVTAGSLGLLLAGLVTVLAVRRNKLR